MESSSPSLSLSPSSSAAISAEIRSLPRDFRRSATSPPEVVPRRLDRLEASLHLVRSLADVGVERAGQLLRPDAEDRLVFCRHAEHLADHCDRQRVRQVGDGVHRAALLGGVEQSVDDLLHAGPQRLDGPGAERLADEAAQASVVRRVHEQKWPVLVAHVGVLRAEACRDRLADRAVVGRLAVVTAEVLDVAQDRQAIGVAGEGADAEGGQVDGVFGEDALVDRVRVGAEGRVDWVKGDRLGCGHAMLLLPLCCEGLSHARRSAVTGVTPAEGGSEVHLGYGNRAKEKASRGEPHLSGIPGLAGAWGCPFAPTSPFSWTRYDSVREAAAIIAEVGEAANTFVHTVHKRTLVGLEVA